MPSLTATAERLNAIGRDFLGIAERPDQPSFHAHDSHVEADLAFDDGSAGTSARLVVEHVVERRTTPIHMATRNDGSLRLSLDAKDATRFARALAYAGTEFLAPRRRPRALVGVPLPSLLSHALIAFERDYGEAGYQVPTLPAWSNVLRAFGDEPLTDRELGRRGILAKRVVRVVLRDLARLGWLEPDATRPRAFRLSARAKALEVAARQRLAEVEERWRDRHGLDVIERLRNGLAGVAPRLELEWPWYLTGYGPGDASVTGGSFLPAEAGPPRVPGRGEEWPVVPRDTSVPVAELPLSALLSKVLAAFTVDYEEEHLGALSAASVFLAQVPGDGISLARARAICDIVGSGRSTAERHLCVVVAPGRPSDGTRMVHLTPKARRMRDSYPALVMDIEARWRDTFGARVLDDLREALETVDAETPPGTPDYPDARAWLHPASLKARGAMGRVSDDGQPVHLAWHSGQSRERFVKTPTSG